MNIVKPYARLMAPPGRLPDTPFLREDGEALMRRIEWCARISHRAEDKQDANSWERFIRSVVLDHGDWSVTEHAFVSVDALVDRGITHEWVRHRLFSYTQESTRFVNYEKKMPPSFIDPFPSVPGTHTGWLPAVEQDWEEAIAACEKAYRSLVRSNVAPQLARSVFPNALASRIIVTGNLRNWRHFFIMRTTREAHPQMREVTIPLLAEFKEKIPLLFDDIEPMAKQSEGMKRAR